MRAKILSITERPVTTWETALNAFISFKTLQGISPRAQHDYRLLLSRFYTLYPQAWESGLALRDSFTEWTTAAPIAPDTFNHRFNALRAFWQYCTDEGIRPAESNPFRGIKRRPAPGKFADIDADKVKELLSMPDRKTWAGLRDYALILFSLDTAARPCEALRLTPGDIDLHACVATISAEKAKTRRPRIVPFSATTADALKKFLIHRPPEWDNEAPFFASVTGRPLPVSRWHSRLKKYRLQDGFTFKPYGLRHAACTLHLRAGMNGETLQRLMGHSTPTMTQRYIHLTNDDLKKAQALTSPVEALAPREKRAPRRIQ